MVQTVSWWAEEYSAVAGGVDVLLIGGGFSLDLGEGADFGAALFAVQEFGVCVVVVHLG